MNDGLDKYLNQFQKDVCIKFAEFIRTTEQRPYGDTWDISDGWFPGNIKTDEDIYMSFLKFEEWKYEKGIIKTPVGYNWDGNLYTNNQLYLRYSNGL